MMEIKTDQDAQNTRVDKYLDEARTNLENLDATARYNLNLLDRGFQQASSDHIETIGMLDGIDARLRDLQKQLLSSIPSKARRRQNPTRTSYKDPFANSLAGTAEAANRDISARSNIFRREVASRCTTYLMQVVKPGILITESRGQLHQKLIALPDHGYMKCTLVEKQHYVQQIQSLRILVWLLRRKLPIATSALFRSRQYSSDLLHGATLAFATEKRQKQVRVLTHLNVLNPNNGLSWLNLPDISGSKDIHFVPESM